MHGMMFIHHVVLGVRKEEVSATKFEAKYC